MSKIIFAILIQFLLIISNIFAAPYTNPVIVNDVSFIKIGTYRGFTDEGSEYQKTYLLSRYMHNTWGEARAICKSFDLELMTLETLNEANSFLAMADNHSYFRAFNSIFILLDGTTLTPKSATDWYWTQSGKKISYPISWIRNQPDNYLNNEKCFTIGRRTSADKFGFNDINCSEVIFQFLCQRYDIFVP